MKLSTYELTTLNIILENRADDLSKFIQTEDYESKHGNMADAVRTADVRYLADIRAIQSKVNAAI